MPPFIKNVSRIFALPFVRLGFQPDGSLAYWGEMSKGTPQADGTIINQTRYCENADSTHHPSQTAYALAIDFNLMPEETMARKIEVVDYCPEWKEKFRQEAAKIQEI